MGPSFVCESCGQRRKGRPKVTVTGWSICLPCHDSLLGAAAGALASGYRAGPTIASAGIFARLRAARRQKRD
jgi:hypothetical protein